jgi:hypothetical protein
MVIGYLRLAVLYNISRHLLIVITVFGEYVFQTLSSVLYIGNTEHTLVDVKSEEACKAVDEGCGCCCSGINPLLLIITFHDMP